MANDDVMHQGKTVAQWEKDFNGMFTKDQLLKLIRGGCDLQKILISGLDEDESIDDKQLFKGEEFFFNEADQSTISPKIEFVTYDSNGNVIAKNLINNDEVTSVSLEYLSNCMDDFNAAAKAFPNSIHQTAMIFVDGKPLSTISSVRKAQLRRLIDTMNESTSADEDAALNEAMNDNIVTVRDFASSLKRNLAKDEDKIMFRIKKQPYEVFDIHSKGGTTVVDLIPAVANAQLNEAAVLDLDIDTVADLIDEITGITKAPNSTTITIEDKSGVEYEIESLAEYHGNLSIQIKRSGSLDESLPWEDESGITDEQWEEASEWFEANGFKIHDSDEGGFTFAKPINGKQFYNGKDGYDLYLKMKDSVMNEGRNWRTGGYGGYGRSYRSYGEIGAPRGREISWFEVSDLDPKARGKMSEWRVGPSNFPFKDLLYPERKYKLGTTVLRSKFLKAGDESGVKYIAVPSYLSAIKNNDEAAIELLKSLGIPLDLTFGYKPGEDFSATYTIQA